MGVTPRTDSITLGSVQKTAREIEFKVDGKGASAWGSGRDRYRVEGIAKRGKELKVFVQYKRGGGVRVAGIDLGNYNGGWKNLFENSLEALKGFRRYLLIANMLKATFHVR